MSRRSLLSTSRAVLWYAAFAAVATLLIVNGLSARRFWEQSKPLVRLQAERASQVAQIGDYAAMGERMRQLVDRVRQERTQIFSMLRHCQGREDFVVKSGPRIVSCKNFYDSSQKKPAVFFYLPPGKHKLLYVSAEAGSPAEMSKFMFERDTSGMDFDSIELAGDNVYEIRFFPITPETPSPAGFELLGPGSAGEDLLVDKVDLRFSDPVVGVAEGHGTDWNHCLPDQGAARAKRLPNGQVVAITNLARQTFRFPAAAEGGARREGSRGGVRFFIESTAEPHDAREVALDELVSFMRQPASASENLADLFHRAEGFVALSRQQSTSRD